MATKKKTSKKKATTGKKAQKKELSQPVRIALASGFLLVFVVACLFALVGLRDRFGDASAIVYEEPVQQLHTETVQVSYSYADVLDLVDRQLINGPNAMGWQRLNSNGDVQVRKIFGEYPASQFLAELETHIDRTGAPAQLKSNRSKGTLELLWQGKVRLQLRYSIPEPVVVKQGKIALIMDDMGGSLTKMRQLLDLGIPVTPAILPGTEYAKKSSQLLQDKQHEFMIHMPMQPRSYPRTNPGKNALLVDQTPEVKKRLVQSYVESLPGAVGGNNHMGSRFTEDTESMRIVLKELKKHKFFFIDSRTIGSSVAFNEARKLGLKTGTRNIFLDNEEDVSYIRRQIRKMVSMASKNREIIAICHPYKETFEALKQEIDWLKSQPVDFVVASEIVHSY